MKAVHLASGGLDSMVMTYDHLDRGHDIRCIGFDYGQTHYKEIDAAKSICHKLGISYEVVQLARVFSKSSLLGGSGSVVVPNRNMVFLSVAAAIAEGDGREFVTYGATKEDFEGFPDCRPGFVESVNATLGMAGLKVRVQTPYVHLSKREVAQIGKRLNVPMDLTWTCYLGGQEPCMECPACKLRNGALE